MGERQHPTLVLHRDVSDPTLGVRGERQHLTLADTSVRDPTHVTRESHSFTHTRTIPPQSQIGVTALGLLLIAPPHEGMARLSWPGWLVTHRDKCPSPGIEPGHGSPIQVLTGPDVG